MKVDRFHELNAFIAVVDAGGFTAAANRTGGYHVLTAESAGIGQGSTFTVELPRVHTSLPEASEVLVDQRARSPQRILLVDDNEDSLRWLETLLFMEGHDCRTASDGKTALFLNTTLRPTVAVVDIGLPDMTGFDVAVSIRDWRDKNPLTLIALRGYATAKFHKEAIQAGVDYYFAKPVPISKLLKLLEGLPSHQTIDTD